jgi:putative NADH-flavin reductase
MKALIVLAIAIMLLTACSGEGKKDGALLATAGDPPPTLASQSEPLQILVIGGTSGTGLEVVKLALARGHKVTAMSRRPQRMRLTHENLEARQGDILDVAAVKAAVKNKDAVVNAVGIKPTREPVTVFSKGIQHLLDVMAKQEVNRLVAVTGIGAGDSRGHGGFFFDRILQPLALKTIYEDKDRAETLIAESAVDWTIVRPGALTNEPAETRYRVIQDLTGVTAGSIARADVAQFIVAALEAGSYEGSTVLLSN